MADTRSLKAQVSQLRNLRSLVKSYGELAVTRMNRSRASVLYSRDFLGQINTVFKEVRRSHAAETGSLSKRKISKSGEYVTFLSHNGKTASVFLAANTRLYGDIIQRTYKKFVQDVKTNDTEVVLVGKVALSMFKASLPDKPFTYFDFPDSHVDRVALEEIMSHLVHYQEIHVFYGKYRNVISQEPTLYKISSDVTSYAGAKEEVEDPNPTHYLFEPSLDTILKYFESEIFAVLFNQTMAESQLAKFASRLVAMDRAEQNIDKAITTNHNELLRVTHDYKNKKQQNMVSSILTRFR